MADPRLLKRSRSISVRYTGSVSVVYCMPSMFHASQVRILTFQPTAACTTPFTAGIPARHETASLWTSWGSPTSHLTSRNSTSLPSPSLCFVAVSSSDVEDCLERTTMCLAPHLAINRHISVPSPPGPPAIMYVPSALSSELESLFTTAFTSVLSCASRTTFPVCFRDCRSLKASSISVI